jgi:hypothetical protein
MANATQSNFDHEEVLDSDLLDNDDEGVNVLATDDDYRLLESGDYQDPRNESIQTPPGTPPRTITSPTSIVKERTPPISNKQHKTKINVYIHSRSRVNLLKAATMSYICNPDFYHRRRILEQIVRRAELVLLQQEPYHTLINTGHNISFKDPQLSYKVLAIDENFLIDFVADIPSMSYVQTEPQPPQPFFEQSPDCQYSQTDVSFLFEADIIKTPVKPKTRDASTVTFDAALVNPILDQIRNCVTPWHTALSQMEPPATSTSTATSRRAAPSLSDMADTPPRHHTQRERDAPVRARLGPPIERSFNRPQGRPRDRSRDRSRGSSKEDSRNKRQRK